MPAGELVVEHADWFAFGREDGQVLRAHSQPVGRVDIRQGRRPYALNDGEVEHGLKAFGCQSRAQDGELWTRIDGDLFALGRVDDRPRSPQPLFSRLNVPRRPQLYVEHGRLGQAARPHTGAEAVSRTVRFDGLNEPEYGAEPGGGAFLVGRFRICLQVTK